MLSSIEYLTALANKDYTLGYLQGCACLMVNNIVGQGGIVIKKLFLLSLSLWIGRLSLVPQDLEMIKMARDVLYIYIYWKLTLDSLKLPVTENTENTFRFQFLVFRLW